MNSNLKSKINWTAASIAILGLLITFDIIPAAMKADLIILITVLGPLLILFFRSTWTGSDKWMSRAWARLTRASDQDHE